VTPAEFRCLREYLGLPLGWTAAALDVAERTVNRWESGVTPVPEHAAKALRKLSLYTDTAVASLMAKQPTMLRTTASDAVVAPGLPGSWHRAVCARVADHLGVRIDYDDQRITAIRRVPPVMDPLASRRGNIPKDVAAAYANTVRCRRDGHTWDPRGDGKVSTCSVCGTERDDTGERPVYRYPAGYVR